MNVTDQPTYQNPGPGAYSPYLGLGTASHGSPGITLKSRLAVKQQNSSPGPGAYQVSTLFGDGTKGCTLAGRTQTKGTSDTPGPGAYCPSPTRKVGGSMMAGRTFKPGVLDWEYRKKMDSPSPCQYNVERQNVGKPISLAGRTEITLRNDNPGPGTYQSGTNFGKGARGCSLAGRTASNENADTNPGPGSYQLGSTMRKGGISISGRPAKRGGIME